MKPRLPLKAQRRFDRKGQLGFRTEARVNSKRFGGFPLAGKRLPPGGGIEICRRVGKAAVDSHLPHHPPVFPDRPLVGFGILAGPFFPELLKKAMVDQTMLGSDFRGGVFCLAAPDAGGFQNNRPQPRGLQKICGEHSRQPRADHRGVRLDIPGERGPPGECFGFAPE